jgi:glutaredoxin
MIKLYTTGCPQCNVLKSKLDSKGIKYESITSLEIIQEVAKSQGFRSVPILEVDGNYMDFISSIKYFS